MLILPARDMARSDGGGKARDPCRAPTVGMPARPIPAAKRRTQMEATALKGDGQVIGGNVKEAVGTLTGDQKTQNAGIADQLTGRTNQAIGAAKGFAKDRPYTAAALAGVVGLALLNTLRGRR
jgi:uncharacterized protein YjbJ (UPF0337 family)